jgi:hypothetical protein
MSLPNKAWPCSRASYADAFNVCGSVDGHPKHGMAFYWIEEVGIGSVQRTFEHAPSIAWSVFGVCPHAYSPPVRLR